ncbi:MAG: hypothetical protein AWM53_00870 [Candidatus Dichloromethanomonas elyunquensis]|nr:MAG: hypothetical protein AWM53_00870 [Candidatus Dichloromethanomonas elyunquensis]
MDILNSKYIGMTKEKRLKNLSSIAKRITEFRYDNDHKEIKEVVSEAAKTHLSSIKRKPGDSPGFLSLWLGTSF